MSHFPSRPAGDSAPAARPAARPDLEAALAAVNRDLAATLPEAGPMRLLCTPSHDEDVPDQYHAALPDGRWHDGVTDPVAADIADAAQETVQAVLWQVWPVCPEHRGGVHAEARSDGGRAVWWCRAGEGHELCEVGGLSQTLGQARRAPRRKERRRAG